MTWKFGLFILLCTTRFLAASPLDEKGPAYFVGRYGPAKSTKGVSQNSFFHSSQGAVAIKGQFTQRSFQQDKLQVETVFFLPSLKLAAVNLRMGQAWTEEQVQAALKAYGGEWKSVKLANALVKEWVAPDGSNAIFLLSSLHIQSKPVVDAIAKELAEQEAKRKAVPKF